MREILDSYRASLKYWPAFLLVHLVVQLLSAAIILPLSGLVLAAVLAASAGGAVTDADIARLLLTPAGAAGLLAVGSFMVLATVMEVTVMCAVLRRNEHSPVRAVLSGLAAFLAQSPRILSFGVQFLVRVIALSVPFLAVGGLVAWLTLAEYDINYYLTYRPPAFLAAVAIGGVLVAGLAALLVWRLSGWVLSLHLIVFAGEAPRRAFAASLARVSGRRIAIAGRIAGWAVVNALLLALVAAIAGWMLSRALALTGANLHLVVLAAGLLFVAWGLANALVQAVSNGALAALLERFYREAVGEGAAQQAPPARPEASHARAVALLLGVALVLATGGLALGDGLLERVGAQRQVEIIAHRGAAASKPENTMASVEQALEDRADWVEIDVQETADGEVIVAHDSDFMKLAGVNLKVWNATMADIERIDIGSWFDAAYAGERTPTLRQVLAAAKGRGKVLIELKYYGHDVSLESRVADVVEETEMSAEIAVMSLKIPGVLKMHALKPEWPYGILAAKALGDLSRLGANFLAVNTGQVSVSLVRRAHQRGQKLYVWTVDDPLTMARMISMGVDGLITNEPALARRVMEERNRLSTPERLLLWASDRLRLKNFDLTGDESDA